MKRVFVGSILATLLAFSAHAADFADAYDFLLSVFDPTGPINTGQTVFPTLVIPVGGELEAMGTAYTAVSRNVSFLESNPAASSLLDFTEFGVQHKNLISDANLESLLYTTRWNNFGIGAGLKFLHVPFTGYGSQGQQTTSFRYTESVLALNASYNLLHSFSFNGIAIGTNLKFAYRGIPDVPGLIQDQSAFGFMADAGLLTRFDFLKFYPSRTRNFSIGFAAKNFGPLVLKEPLPSMLTAGIAYSPLRPLIISFDYNLPVSLLPSSPPEAPGFATGVSVALTNFLTSDMGFLLKGGDPRFSVGADVNLNDISVRVNYTIDMTTQLGAIDNFSLQASFNFGDRGREEFMRKVENLYLDALDALAGGDFQKTVELCRKIIQLDPSFDPARTTLNNALRTQDLENQMENLKKPTDLTPGSSPQTPGSAAQPSG